MAIKVWDERNPPKNLCCSPPPPSNITSSSISYSPSNPSAWTSPIPSNVQQALDALANRPAGGELSGTYPNPILVNSAVTGKVLTGLSIVNSVVVATDSLLSAIGKLQGQINAINSTPLSLTNGRVFIGNAINQAQEQTIGGELSITNTGVATVANSAVISKVLTGLIGLTGTIAPTDTILEAFGKIQTALANSLTNTLPSGRILVGDATNLANDVDMSGEALIDNTGAVTLVNSAVIGKILTGLTLTNAQISATDSILVAFGKLQAQLNNNVGFNLTSGNIWVGDSGNLPVERVLSGEATLNNTGVLTLNNNAVINKVLTGFILQSGTIAATDSILVAFGKIQNAINSTISNSLPNTQILVGNASNIATAVNMSGEATIANTGAVTLLNSAVINKILTGFALVSGTVSATDSILTAFGKLQNSVNNAQTNVLPNTQILVGNASNIATAVNMSGEATIANTGAVTLLNSAVIAKVLTGYVLVSGTIAATDTILQAFGKVQSQINTILSTYQSSTLPNGQVWIGNASNVATARTISSELSISNTGVATLDNNSVLNKTIYSPFTPVIASIATSDSIKTAFEKTQGQLDNVLTEWVSPPPTSTSTGEQGQKAFDSNYVYFCVLTDTWVRVARDLTIW